MMHDLTNASETPRGERLGEVIAVTSSTFMAESYTLHTAPTYGSLVRVGGPDGQRFYGLCYGVTTQSIEPGRPVMAWGHDEETEDNILRHQPQLAHLLHTTWECLLVGDAEGGTTGPTQRIPPRPPRVHSFVYTVPADEARLFYQRVDYLRFLLRSSVPSVDDLVAASVGHAACYGRDRTVLIEAARLIARLLAHDHQRLMAILGLLDTSYQAASDIIVPLARLPKEGET